MVKNGFKVVTAALISAAATQLLATMTLGKNQIYQLGNGFGETLREADEDDGIIRDFKDLDAAVNEFGEQLGDSSVVDKLLNDEFVDGVTFGYYKKEILGQ